MAGLLVLAMIIAAPAAAAPSAMPSIGITLQPGEAVSAEAREARVIVVWEPGVVSASAVRAQAERRGFSLRRELRLGDRRAAVLSTPPGQDAAAAARSLEAIPGVAYAEPDNTVHATLSPNDPIYTMGLQWPHERIQSEAAWDVTMGDRSVIVAVLDTGVDHEHPELVPALDPDLGRDIVNDDYWADDDEAHGTMVGGVIVAASNNATGMAGVAPGVTLMPVKVLDENGMGFDSDVAEGIYWALDHGADIISMSLGGEGASATLADAVQAAEDAGVLVIAAAGNTGAEGVNYPAAYPWAIAVAATTPTDTVASYSTFGPEVLLSAPGGEITFDDAGKPDWTTTVLSCYPLDLTPSGHLPYAWGFGTSLAVPHVTGAAALLMSHVASASALDVRAALVSTAKDLGDPGADPYYGAGLIQMADALLYVSDDQPPVTTSDARDTYIDSAVIALFADDGSGTGVADTFYRLDGGADTTYTAPFSVTGYGPHELSFWSVDVAGNVEPTRTAAFEIVRPFVAKRLDGSNRYATALAISREVFGAGSAPHVVLATGEDFADALSASALAGVYDGPLLLTPRDTIAPGVMAELDRLGATGVTIVGGTSAVSSVVEAQLRSAGLTVRRIPGSDRYRTASAVAATVRAASGSKIAFVARGDGFADALAVSPLAYAEGIPILLVEPDSIPAGTSFSGVSSVVIAGGTSAVSSAVERSIISRGIAVTRKQGADRYATAVELAGYGVQKGWLTRAYIGMATGAGFADGLAGGAAAGHAGGALVLTDPSVLSAPAAAYLDESRGDVRVLHVYGGESAVGPGPYTTAVALCD
ncbi:MAG: hypothetical protein Kow0067_09850 [Coriobacteriia bacterium]